MGDIPFCTKKPCVEVDITFSPMCGLHIMEAAHYGGHKMALLEALCSPSNKWIKVAQIFAALQKFMVLYYYYTQVISVFNCLLS